MEFFTAQELNDHDTRIHVTTAEDTEMAVCATCAAILPKRAMGLHRYTHKIAGPQECKTCGKTMASSRRMREHVRRVHKKVKKFMCPICFARFVYRASADLCAAKHTGVKSVHCECGKSFLTKAQRSAHRLVAHKFSVEA
jgi:KRAB domain-containing zinc finger protein